MVIYERVSFLESCWERGSMFNLKLFVLVDYFVGEPMKEFSLPFRLDFTGEFINFYYEI